MKILLKYILFVAPLCIWSCTNRNETKLPEAAEVLHKNEKNLTDLIIYDIFSPPVAARIYAYTSLAAHEALRHADPKEPSVVARLNGFSQMSEPAKDKKYNYLLAASVAFYSAMR